jgi:hypothetical protein
MSEQERNPGGNAGPGNGNGDDPGHGAGNPGQGGGRDTANIVVDNVHHKVREGAWVVSDLKAAVGVDASKVLAEITPRGLNDLEDTESIKVRDGMRFMSHARTGASS